MININKSLLHYENKNLDDLPGELWVDAYGFEGLYMVSNKGRIKSVERYVNVGSKYCKKRIIKEKIISQGKIFHNNGFSLFVHLACGKDEITGKHIYKTKSMAGLVLNSFRKPDEYNDSTHHINCCSYDNRLKNLAFEDMSTKRRFEFAKGVRDGKKNTRHFFDTPIKRARATEKFYSVKKERSEVIHKKGYEKRNKSPITVYIKESDTVKSFTCIKNAAEQLGMKEWKLRNAKDSKQYKSVIVVNGTYDLDEFKNLQEYKDRIKKRDKLPITVYIKESDTVYVFDCINDASKQLGIDGWKLRMAKSCVKYKSVIVVNGAYDLDEFKNLQEYKDRIKKVKLHD